MKKQGFNPYLPSWEYIPDGEPYVFNNRVYVYGSHDRFNGYAYCLNDYVCWSAPVEDLADWRYEGVILKTAEVQNNEDCDSCLYAPDVAVGPDGRYYLYYVDSKRSIVSVAVCDTPAGKYEFHGYVHYADGVNLGEREGDEPQFDPGVLVEGDKVYLYTGFCARGDKSRSGAMATVLSSADMLTIMEAPVIVAPSEPYSKGSGFEGHEFFEAPSIRKYGDTYYLIYSSILMHELCYATSKHPTKGFEYRGTIVSNCDMGVSSYKPVNKPMAYGGNNHGSMVEISGKWYIFYHRHTNGTNFSRQGCLEEIKFLEDGSIPQVEMTSCAPNRGPLKGLGEYHAYIACNLFCDEESIYTDFTGAWMNNQFPKITQDGRDGDEEIGYIANMKASATAGFKYFDFKGVKRVKIRVRGYCKGDFEIRTAWNGPVLGKISVAFSNVWQNYSADITIPDGIHPLYITYTGQGSASLASFTLE
jgi:hypothetical protein